jgi:hypothetical protein
MIITYLRRKSAANYIRERHGIPCSRNWLAKLAWQGGGPTYRKAGKFPLYAPADLDAWAVAKVGPRQSSTSVIMTEDAR